MRNNTQYINLHQLLRRYGWGPDRLWVDILLGDYDVLVPDPRHCGERIPAYLKSRVKDAERSEAFRLAASQRYSTWGQAA